MRALEQAAALAAAATTPAELYAATAAARLEQPLADWRTLREVEALSPEAARWKLNRALWNAGVRNLLELLEHKEVWRTLSQGLSPAEHKAVLEASKRVVGELLSQRRLEAQLEERASASERQGALPDPTCPREELDRWAARVGAQGLLDVPVVAALFDDGSPEAQAFVRKAAHGKLGVGDAIAGPTWPSLQSRARLTGAPHRIQELCHAWLRRAQAARGLAEDDERAWLAELDATAPDVPALAREDARLRAARARVRDKVHAHPLLARRPVGIAVRDEPGRIELRPSRPSEPRCARTPELTWELSSGRLRCACAGPCGTWLDAIDGALRMLRTPGAHRDSLRALLERPQWHGALRDLTALAEEFTPIEGELGWRLDPSTDGPMPEPVVVLPLKSGGFRTRRLQAGELPGLLERSDRVADRRVAAARPAVIPDARDALGWAGRGRIALQELVGHPRVFLGPRARQPIEVRRAAVATVVARDEGLRIELMVDGRALEPDDLAQLADQKREWGPPYLLGDGVLRVLDAGHALGSLAALLLSHGQRFDEAATEPVLEALHRLESAVPVELDRTLRGEAEEGERRLLLRLELRRDGAVSLVARMQPIPGGPVLLPGEGRRFVHGERDGARFHVQRDLADERARVAALAETLQLEDPDAPECDWLVVSPEAAAEVVARLEGLSARPDGPRVQWTGKPLRFASVSARALRITVSPLHQWFGLDGRLEVGDREVELARLLELVDSGRRFVPVGDGDWARIDDALADALQEAVSGAFLERGRLAISGLHAPALDQLSRAGVRIEVPPEWARARERIAEAATTAVVVPMALRGELRPYQQAGMQWMVRCAAWAPGCVLADDMGLGKTIQTLALLLHRRDAGPVLVVAPASVGFNWLREVQAFAPSLRAQLYRGPEREALLSDLGSGDLLVTSWALLTRDAEALQKVAFGTVVFDEAQAAKNPDSARAAAARDLRGGFTVALTGTPVENRPEELWSLFSLVAPGLLGSREAFRRRYALPIGRGEEAPMARLAALVRPLMLRRLKAEVARDLPPRIDVDARVQLGVDERALYDEVRRAGLAALELTRSRDGRKDGPLRLQALALLTRLRQAACHPRLVDHDSELRSAKLERVRELVAELRDGGHQALLFSQFLGHLAVVREALLDDGCVVRSIDGSTPLSKRQDEIDRFQAGDGDVFLISLKAGGVGLNLTAASYVLHLDPWWNPSVQDQATDRAHRIGQTQPVTVYRLVARDTVEERILELHQRKRELVTALLAGSGEGAGLGTEEILGLLEG